MNLEIKLRYKYLHFLTIFSLLLITVCGGGEKKTESTQTPSKSAQEEVEEKSYILVDGSSSIFHFSSLRHNGSKFYER